MKALRRQGFTLLEILVAITITALLVAAAVRAFRDIHRFTARIGAGLHRERASEIFLDRLERELAAAMIFTRAKGSRPETHPWLFRGVDGFEGSAESDSIKFITTAPSRAAGSPSAAGLRMVSYGVVSDEDGQLDLRRAEEALPRGESKQIFLADSVAVLEDVGEFRMSYHDADSEKWLENWDSTQIELLDRLPDKVRVSLVVWQQDPNGTLVEGPESSRTVLIMSSTSYLQGAYSQTGEDNDPNGLEEDSDEECATTVSECVDSFQELLLEAPSNVRALAEEEATVRPDDCFNPEGPLADLLRAYGDLYLECP